MKFESLSQLLDAIKSHSQYSKEIKLKRLKKELSILSTYQNPSTFIDTIELTSVGIELLVKNQFRQSIFEYKMLLDFEYPFSRPFIFFLKKGSSYAECQDLMDIVLEGSNWGPSLMLSYFLDRIQSISEIIRQNRIYQIKRLYHLKQNYRKHFLQQMGLHLFQIEEYVPNYLIKTTKKRVMSLTNETLLLFSASQTNENMVLQFWKPISEISTAKASVRSNQKFSLEISYRQNDKDIKIYLGGQSKIETILGYLNPIEMIERKIIQIEKNINSLVRGKYWNDNQEMIKDFTQLVEFYSLKDGLKAQKYLKLMKELIVRFYQPQGPDQNQIKAKMPNDQTPT